MNVMPKIYQIIEERRGFKGRIISEVPAIALSQAGFVVSFLVSITDFGILLSCTEIQRRGEHIAIF